MVYNISSGLITSYLNTHGKTQMTPEKMFKTLSLQMGGDGEKIKKSQLDNYIQKAESNPKNSNKLRLVALKELQKNWDTISNKKDSITFGDLSDYQFLLALAFVDDIEKPEESENFEKAKKSKEEDSKAKNKNNLSDYLKEATNKDEKGLSKDDLTEHLKSLLSNDSKDVDNSEEIATITNLIADFDNLSGGSEHITAESLALTKGHKA